jgi:hypothetical protein
MKPKPQEQQLELFEAPEPPPPRHYTTGNHATYTYRQGPNDYEPGHPWFYLLGGIPIPPEAIKADPKREWALYGKDAKLTGEKLLQAIRSTKAGIREDMERHRHLSTWGMRDEWRAPWEECPKLELAGALALTHNHVLSGRQQLQALNKLWIQERNRPKKKLRKKKK